MDRDLRHLRAYAVTNAKCMNPKLMSVMIVINISIAAIILHNILNPAPKELPGLRMKSR